MASSTTARGASQRTSSSRKLGPSTEGDDQSPLLELYPHDGEHFGPSSSRPDSDAQRAPTAAGTAGSVPVGSSTPPTRRIMSLPIPLHGGSASRLMSNVRMRMGAGTTATHLAAVPAPPLSRHEMEMNRRKAYRSYAGDWLVPLRSFFGRLDVLMSLFSLLLYRVLTFAIA